MKLTEVKETENATDVAAKNVDAATLMKCVGIIGLINRTQSNKVSSSFASQNVTRRVEKILMNFNGQ